MTKEEFVKAHEALLKQLFPDDEARRFIQVLAHKAWDNGYAFRIQEEELNKGASF